MNLKNKKIKNSFIFLLTSFFIFFGLFVLWNLLQGRGRNESADHQWFKGNLHVHTNRIDGDTAPDEVIDWYLKKGYDFLAITDHDLRFDKPGVRRGWGRRILVMAGEEVTLGKHKHGSIHIGAVHTQSAIPHDIGKLDEGRDEDSRRWLQYRGNRPEAIAASMDIMGAVSRLKKLIPEIERQGAISVLNHPALSVKLSLFARLKELPMFIELWNPHEFIPYYNKKQPLDTEIIWDTALSQGKKIYAVTGDDAHYFKKAKTSTPGHVWLWVKAQELSPNAIIDALKRGDSYVSTGIILKRVEWVKPQKQIIVEVEARPGHHYRILFIGKEGRLLQQTDASQAVYPVKGDELYVRVKVTERKGLKACAQPFFISG